MLALLLRLEGEQHVAAAGVQQINLRADADRERPVARRVHLRHHHRLATLVDGEMAGLLRLPRQSSQDRRGLRHEPAQRRVLVRQREQFQAQLVAVICGAHHVAAPHQAVQHAVDLVRRAGERLGDLGLREALLGGSQQFQDVETLVERGCPIALGGR